MLIFCTVGQDVGTGNNNLMGTDCVAQGFLTIDIKFTKNVVEQNNRLNIGNLFDNTDFKEF